MYFFFLRYDKFSDETGNRQGWRYCRKEGAVCRVCFRYTCWRRRYELLLNVQCHDKILFYPPMNSRKTRYLNVYCSGAAFLIVSYHPYIRVTVTAESALLPRDEVNTLVKHVAEELDLLYSIANSIRPIRPSQD